MIYDKLSLNHYNKEKVLVMSSNNCAGHNTIKFFILNYSLSSIITFSLWLSYIDVNDNIIIR